AGFLYANRRTWLNSTVKRKTSLIPFLEVPRHQDTFGTIPFHPLPVVTSWVWLWASFSLYFRTFQSLQRWGRGLWRLKIEFLNCGPCALVHNELAVIAKVLQRRQAHRWCQSVSHPRLSQACTL
ncbi:mCG145947, partial [Mus musculus]